MTGFSGRLCFRRRSQLNRCLCGEQQERECFLQIKPDRIIGVAQVADRDVLAGIRCEERSKTMKTKTNLKAASATGGAGAGKMPKV
jgi:hypothetical protein